MLGWGAQVGVLEKVRFGILDIKVIKARLAIWQRNKESAVN